GMPEEMTRHEHRDDEGRARDRGPASDGRPPDRPPPLLRTLLADHPRPRPGPGGEPAHTPRRGTRAVDAVSRLRGRDQVVSQRSPRRTNPNIFARYVPLISRDRPGHDRITARAGHKSSTSEL